MKYKIYYQEDSKVYKKIVECEDINSLKLPTNVLKIKKQDKLFENRRQTFRLKEIYQIFYELNMMLDSKLDLITSLEILINSRKNKKSKDFLQELLNSVKKAKGLDFDDKKFKLDSVVKSFLIIVNKRGNLVVSIKALSKLLNYQLQVKNSLKKAFSYPLVLVATLFISLVSIFYFVLPSFESLIKSNAIQTNNATILLYMIKDFFEKYFFFFSSFLIFFFLIVVFLYKLNSKFRYIYEKILLTKIPFLSKILLYFELYKVFIILNILQKENYEFFDTLSSLNYLIKNKYLLDKIALIETLIKSGKSITYAFEATKLFDDFVLNLIQTGEKSNSLMLVTFEIEKVYKIGFENRVKLLSYWVQPMVFLMIMGLILWIIYAIFVPMWSMSDMIKF